MKQAVTLRLDPELLAAARICAQKENRTLTNFLETVLKQHMTTAHQLSDTSLRPPKKDTASGRKPASAEKSGARP